jgi:hypothetical protein
MGPDDEEMLETIRRSLEDNRVDLYLQPVVSLPQRKVRYYEAMSRLNAGDSYGMGADIGLSGSRLHAKGPIGLEQLTCEKYVAFGSGQLRYPHPVPETYFDAIMLKRP